MFRPAFLAIPLTVAACTSAGLAFAAPSPSKPHPATGASAPPTGSLQIVLRPQSLHVVDTRRRLDHHLPRLRRLRRHANRTRAVRLHHRRPSRRARAVQRHDRPPRRPARDPGRRRQRRHRRRQQRLRRRPRHRDRRGSPQQRRRHRPLPPVATTDRGRRGLPAAARRSTEQTPALAPGPKAALSRGSASAPRAIGMDEQHNRRAARRSERRA